MAQYTQWRLPLIPQFAGLEHDGIPDMYELIVCRVRTPDSPDLGSWAAGTPIYREDAEIGQGSTERTAADHITLDSTLPVCIKLGNRKLKRESETGKFVWEKMDFTLMDHFSYSGVSDGADVSEVLSDSGSSLLRHIFLVDYLYAIHLRRVKGNDRDDVVEHIFTGFVDPNKIQWDDKYLLNAGTSDELQISVAQVTADMATTVSEKYTVEEFLTNSFDKPTLSDMTNDGPEGFIATVEPFYGGINIRKGRGLINAITTGLLGSGYSGPWEWSQVARTKDVNVLFNTLDTNNVTTEHFELAMYKNDSVNVAIPFPNGQLRGMTFDKLLEKVCNALWIDYDLARVATTFVPYWHTAWNGDGWDSRPISTTDHPFEVLNFIFQIFFGLNPHYRAIAPGGQSPWASFPCSLDRGAHLGDILSIINQIFVYYLTYDFDTTTGKPQAVFLDALADHGDIPSDWKVQDQGGDKERKLLAKHVEVEVAGDKEKAFCPSKKGDPATIKVQWRVRPWGEVDHVRLGNLVLDSGKAAHLQDGFYIRADSVDDNGYPELNGAGWFGGSLLYGYRSTTSNDIYPARFDNSSGKLGGTDFSGFYSATHWVYKGADAEPDAIYGNIQVGVARAHAFRVTGKKRTRTRTYTSITKDGLITNVKPLLKTTIRLNGVGDVDYLATEIDQDLINGITAVELEEYTPLTALPELAVTFESGEGLTGGSSGSAVSSGQTSGDTDTSGLVTKSPISTTRNDIYTMDDVPGLRVFGSAGQADVLQSWNSTNDNTTWTEVARVSAEGYIVGQRLSSAGIISSSVVSHGSAYTLTTADSCTLANTTAGAFSLTMDALPVEGQEHSIVRVNSGANDLTILPGVGQTIAGGSSLTLSTQWSSVLLKYDGVSNWNILSAYGSAASLTGAVIIAPNTPGRNHIQIGATNTEGLIITQITSGTGNIFEAQDATGAKNFWIDANNIPRVEDTLHSDRIEITRQLQITADSATAALTIEAAAAQALPLADIRSNGTVVRYFGIEADGKAAFGDVTAATQIDTDGRLALRAAADIGAGFVLNPAINQNVIINANTSTVRVVGPAGNFSIGGITGGQNGARLTINNETAFTMTLTHHDAGSTAGNRLSLPGNANYVVPANGTVTLWYDATGKVIQGALWRPIHP